MTCRSSARRKPWLSRACVLALLLLPVSGLSGSDDPKVEEESVRTYLQEHPELLVDNPALVDAALAEARARGEGEAVEERRGAIAALKAYAQPSPPGDARDVKLQIVFFGFTHCPDVCPTGLMNIADALSLAGASAQSVEPLFITVDPERDTVEQTREYAAYFHPSIRGLSGPAAMIERAEAAFSASAEKVNSSNATGDYTVSHSSYIYFVSAGEIRERFAANSDPRVMANAIERAVLQAPTR